MAWAKGLTTGTLVRYETSCSRLPGNHVEDVDVRKSDYLSASVAEVPSASALQILRRLGSIFTSVYAAVQKLKKDSWLELQFSLADNSKMNVVYLLNIS
ncbi:hypothetical protein Tco_1245710 [Tanacetum coccineum]